MTLNMTFSTHNEDVNDVVDEHDASTHNVDAAFDVDEHDVVVDDDVVVSLDVVAAFVVFVVVCRRIFRDRNSNKGESIF